MASACAIMNQSNKKSKSTPLKMMCGVVHAVQSITTRLWAPNCHFVDDRCEEKYGCNGLIGHLLFDEVKLNSDMAWNCPTNKVVGFCMHGGKLDLKYQLRFLI
jgi:hypothetical protein